MYCGIIDFVIICPKIKLIKRITSVNGIKIAVCVNSFFLKNAVLPNSKEKQIKKRPIAIANKTKKINIFSVTKNGVLKIIVKKYCESQFSLSTGG